MLNLAKIERIGTSGLKVWVGSKATVPQGKIGSLKVSRLLLGGNLLTHSTHNRGLKYVYNVTGNYDTESM